MTAPTRRISVALCTFNGGRYLQAQLHSLIAQTHRPHEVVAFDDGSTDDTVEQLNQFAAVAPFPVHVTRNPDRVGPAKNFERAIAACTGEVIACCDQDDVWRADKLAVLGAAFDRQPDLGFAFSDADAIDAQGRPLGYRLWDGVAFTPPLRRRFAAGRGFDVLVRYNVVTGATLAFAAHLRPLVLPVGPRWMHDGWIALLASAVAPAVAIAEPLVGYRQHPDQTQGVARRTLWRQICLAWNMPPDQFEREVSAYRAAAEQLARWPTDPRAAASGLVVPEVAVARLNAKADHYRTRSDIRLKRLSRLRPSVGELLSLRYRRYSLGWKSFAQDVFL